MSYYEPPDGPDVFSCPRCGFETLDEEALCFCEQRAAGLLLLWWEEELLQGT